MATLWPTGDDLIEWIGGTVSTLLQSIAQDLVDDVTDDALARIPTAALPSSRRPGGGNVDCPPRLRRALIFEAAHTYLGRAAGAGVELGPELATRIKGMHPQAAKFMSTLTNWPEP